jgi:hypothetical protein
MCVGVQSECFVCGIDKMMSMKEKRRKEKEKKKMGAILHFYIIRHGALGV